MQPVCPFTVSAEAGEAFCLAADVQMKLEVKHEAGSNLVEAAMVLKREDPKSEACVYVSLSSTTGCY